MKISSSHSSWFPVISWLKSPQNNLRRRFRPSLPISFLNLFLGLGLWEDEELSKVVVRETWSSVDMEWLAEGVWRLVVVRGFGICAIWKGSGRFWEWEKESARLVRGSGTCGSIKWEETGGPGQWASSAIGGPYKVIRSVGSISGEVHSMGPTIWLDSKWNWAKEASRRWFSFACCESGLVLESPLSKWKSSWHIRRERLDSGYIGDGVSVVICTIVMSVACWVSDSSFKPWVSNQTSNLRLESCSLSRWSSVWWSCDRVAFARKGPASSILTQWRLDPSGGCQGELGRGIDVSVDWVGGLPIAGGLASSISVAVG